jgi:starch synthase
MYKILIAATELAEVASVGGIAEYVFGLAGALMKNGHDVRVALPAYDYLARHPGTAIEKERGAPERAKRLVVRLGFGASEVTPVYRLDLECPAGSHRKLPVLLFGGHKHFSSVHAGTQAYDWPTHDPWIVFSRAVVDYVLRDDTEWKPDIVHCQDAHTALIPVYLKQIGATKGSGSAVSSVLTIHNLLNKGEGPPGLVSFAGLPDEMFPEYFEHFGQSSCLKAGLLSAGAVNTVSRTYAREICESAEFGFGLEGVLSLLRDREKLEGIVNGIDEVRWSLRGLQYDALDSVDAALRAKHAERQRLFSEWKWQVSGEPTIAFRGRWDEQKGVTLLAQSLPYIAEIARVVIVTWGTPGPPALRDAWKQLNELADEHPQRVLVNPPGVTGVKETGAHYQIADFFLMPSRYEPCGLTQQECQRFGTIPIVRRTGGLADTVAERDDPRFPSPNGFLFDEFDSDAMFAAISRAIDQFRDMGKRQTLIRNGLRQNNDWRTRVREYEGLYQKALRSAS